MASVEINISDELLDDLSKRFFWTDYQVQEVLSTGKNEDAFAALIVARVNGLTIKIWADEHPPPHFHVSFQGQDASFSIIDCSRLRGVVGLEKYETEIHAWWAKNQNRLVEKWNASRPSDCPVGPIVERPKLPISSETDSPSFSELERELQKLLSKMPTPNKQA